MGDVISQRVVIVKVVPMLEDRGGIRGIKGSVPNAARCGVGE